jgi:hypothetical protein
MTARRVHVAAWTLVAIGAGSGSAAAADRVTVVRAGDAEPPVTEVATRAWAELNAGGVAARLVECAPGAPNCPVGVDGRRELTLAVMSVREAGEIVTRVDVSVPGRGTAQARRTVSFAQPAADAKVIAIRAVELVHAALLEDAEEVASPAVPAVEDGEVPGVRARLPPPYRPFRVGASLGTLRSLGGLTPAYGLVVRADWVGKRGLGVSVTATSPMFGEMNVTLLHGSVRTYEEVLAVQGVQRFRQDARFQPYLSAGAGAYAMTLRFGFPWGEAGMGKNETLVSALLLAGGGFDVALGARLMLTANVQVAFVNPQPAVRLDSGGLGTAGNPSLLMSLGLQRSF